MPSDEEAAARSLLVVESAGDKASLAMALMQAARGFLELQSFT